MAMVQDEQLQVVAERIASDMIAIQPRANDLMRWGDSRSGALAMAAVMTGTLFATVGVYRRVTRHSDVVGVERLYARTVGVDRDRADADVSYVNQRLQQLAVALAMDDDLDELVTGAAGVLVAYVAAGRPAEQRLDEVEAVFGPLREASDDKAGVVAELLPEYLAAWRRALS